MIWYVSSLAFAVAGAGWSFWTGDLLALVGWFGYTASQTVLLVIFVRGK